MNKRLTADFQRHSLVDCQLTRRFGKGRTGANVKNTHARVHTCKAVMGVKSQNKNKLCVCVQVKDCAETHIRFGIQRNDDDDDYGDDK